MVISNKLLINKQNYKLTEKLLLFDKENINFKLANLVKYQKYVELFKIIKLRKYFFTK